MTVPPPVGNPDALQACLALTAALYRSPSAALKEDLASGRIGELCRELAEALDLTPPELVDTDWSTVQTSFVSLFVTNPHGIVAPPYTGYARDDELLGPSCDALKATYHAYGLTLCETFRDLPDHVSVVAEAGLLLIQTERVDAALTLTRDYVHPWFARYASAVAAADESGIYGPLTGFLALAFSRLADSLAFVEVQDEVTA
jgi:TorA maturation chaperone TorD